MVTRLHVDDEDAAEQLAAAIDARGHEVAVVRERFAGEDDDEAIEYVVCTTAGVAELDGLVGDEVFVEADG